MTMTEAIPLCECGCGQPAPIAAKSNGVTPKGQPQRFVRGHSRRIQRGQPPACGCGCGKQVAWDRSRHRWRPYAGAGCYRQATLYKDEAWLRREYAAKTLRQIADECGVSRTTVAKFARKFGVDLRPSHQRRGVRTGSENHAWKGGVAQWPYSKNWTELACQIRDRDQWTCQDCGERRKRWGVSLHVHHIDENKLNDDPANLISLCARCHRKRHGGQT